MSQNVLVLPEITCFISSFLEFVLQMEKKDYVTIHILQQKIRDGCIYFDADPVGVGVVFSTNVSICLNIYILNGLLDFDQNLPVYNTWTCQNPD